MWARRSALNTLAETRPRPRAPAAYIGTPQAGRGAEAKVGDLTMANKLLEAKIERLETARPLRSAEIDAMSQRAWPFRCVLRSRESPRYPSAVGHCPSQ